MNYLIDGAEVTQGRFWSTLADTYFTVSGGRRLSPKMLAREKADMEAGMSTRYGDGPVFSMKPTGKAGA